MQAKKGDKEEEKMSVITTAKVELNHLRDGVQSISEFEYPNAAFYKNSSLEHALKTDLNDSIKDRIEELIKKNVILNKQCYLRIFSDGKVELFSDIYPSLFSSIKKIEITKNLTDPIKNALQTSIDKINNHCLWILDKTKDKYLDKPSNVSSKKKELPSSSPITYSKTSSSKLKNLYQGFLKVLNYIFVKELVHAKLTDLAVLALFIVTILAYSLAIFAPHLGMLAVTNHLSDVLHPVFGALNTTVGLAVFTQAVKNFIKAKKTDNKEDMILALVSILFSFAIITTGITAAVNFSNDNILLKMLFTTCASFTFGVGIYNTTKTQAFRKELINKELKEFLKEKILISKEEYENLRKQIFGAVDKKEKNGPKIEEIQKRLKKCLSDEEFEEIMNKELADKIKKEQYLKEKLFDLELQTLQKKKMAKFEKILNNKITNRCIDFINGKKDETLEKDIIKELNLRTFADGCRIFATTLSIMAFGFNIAAPINDANVKNLIYYSTLFVSKLSGFWHNYVRRLRNVPAGEDKQERKSIYAYSKKRDEKTSQLAAVY